MKLGETYKKKDKKPLIIKKKKISSFATVAKLTIRGRRFPLSKLILQKKDRNVSKRFIKGIKKNFEAKNPMSKSNLEPIRKEKKQKKFNVP